MSIRLEMLGGARVVLADGTSRPFKATIRDQALAYLALTGDWVTRDRLGFLFWADSPDTAVRHNVRQLLKRIRQLPWIEGIEVSDDAVRWLVPNDVTDLTGLVAREQWADLPGSGDLLPGLERNSTADFEEWLLSRRRNALSLWQSAVVAAASQADVDGDPTRGLRLLEPLLDLIHGAEVMVPYMTIAMKAGRRDLAIAGFQRVAAQLSIELGVDPPAEAIDLMRRLESQPTNQPAEPARQWVVGRQLELNEIKLLLARPECRLLTIVGAAGIGKSTIAREICGDASGRYVDRSSFVSLENVLDPDDVLASIATGLAVSLDARADPFDQLITALRKRNMLLALDNAEHLRPAWPLFSRLIQACPRLQMLVTSRERLRLEGEWVYELAGLRDADAIRLFTEMGKRLAPDVEVSAGEAQAISRVVGASPLGLELAAPWLRVMAASEIAVEIQSDQALLSGGHRDGPARHRSIAATMKHSWDLASDCERNTVEALSVLAAPYPRELAAEVGGATNTVLRDLLDQSLVQRRDDGTFWSHPLVRGYAAARLAEDRQRELEVRRRHARAILSLVESAVDDSARQALVEDVLAACRHAIESEAIELMIPALDGVIAVLLASGRIGHGLQLLADATESLTRTAPEHQAPLAAIEHSRSRLLYAQGLHGEAAAAAEEALRAATEADDRVMRVEASLSLGWARKWTVGDQAQYQIVSEALPMAESLDDSGLVAEVLNGMGCSAPTLHECRDHLRRGLDRVGERAQDLRAVLLTNLGMVNWALGDGDLAVDHVRAALDIARSVDDHVRIADDLSSLAFLYADLGDLNTGLRLAADAESAAVVVGFVDTRIYALLVAGEIHRMAGDSAGAFERGHEALTMASAVGNESYVLRALRLHGQLLLDSGDIGTALGTLAFVADRPGATGGDFTSEIINPKVWEQATRDADDEHIDAARSWARSRDLDDLVEFALATSPGRSVP